MSTVRKSVIVPSSCEAMFALVDDVESYPRFLPWCASTEVFERTEAITRARLDIDYHGLKTHISTLNEKEAPSRMGLEFVEGPSPLHRRMALHAPGRRGLQGRALDGLHLRQRHPREAHGRLFGHNAETLVESFVQRAEAVAARPPQA